LLSNPVKESYSTSKIFLSKTSFQSILELSDTTSDQTLTNKEDIKHHEKPGSEFASNYLVTCKTKCSDEAE